MKQAMNLLGLLMFSMLLVSSCGKGKPDTGSDEPVEEAPDAVVEQEEEAPAVSVYWSNLSLREEPVKDGKYITAIKLGEKMTYLGLSARDSANKTDYIKVRLMDGKEGWAQASLIVINGDPAVLIKDADIYSRPDLLTKTDKKYSKMDVVAVMQSQGEWIEVKGKRKEGSWVETGWIKPINISYESADIAVAVFTNRALAKDSPEDQIAGLEDIVKNSDLSTSELIPAVIEMLDQLQNENQ
jgi:hypothetical protein